jgi:hypothetical protein
MALFNVGFVIFPNVTQLDFTGPLQVLSGLPQSATHIIAKSMSPVLSPTSFFRADKAMSSLLFVASAGRFTGYDPG